MIYCNECKYEFDIKVETKQIDKEVEEVFFSCPACHEKYRVYYLNDKVKDMRSQIALMPRHHGRAAVKKQLDKEFNKLEEIYSTQ